MTDNLVYIAIGAYFILLGIAIFLYFRPKFIQEGFTTIAIEGETMPKCLLRDAEAQYLLTMFKEMKVVNPSSDSEMAFDELKLILQKVLCLDADVTGPAAGAYSTYQFPFTTSHDIEPVAHLVGRCVRHVARERDIEMVIDKYSTRGATLINQLCDNRSKGSALTSFQNILDRVKRSITGICVAPKATLDIPPGARDPGYYEPDSIKNLTPYTIMGEKQYI